MQTKACIKCGKPKKLTMFSLNASMKDGRLNTCKECASEAQRAYYRNNIEHCREYARSHSQTPQFKAAQSRYQNKDRKIHPEKVNAWNKVYRAIKSGRLERQPCEVCGDLKVEAHHEDYSKQLDVRWMCFKHHREHHRSNRLNNSESPRGSGL